MKDIITLPEYKVETPNEKLIECMYMISQHQDNKITKRELKDLALNKNLIQVGKKDTQDKEERRDQAAYIAVYHYLFFCKNYNDLLLYYGSFVETIKLIWNNSLFCAILGELSDEYLG
jgi:hypothetical protein